MDEFTSRELKSYLDKVFSLVSKNEGNSEALFPRFIGDTPVNKGFTIRLDERNTQNLLDIAIEQEVVIINESTYYIADISALNNHFNSLIFQTNGTILKSKEITSFIMNRFFTLCKVEYKWIQNMGKSLGIYQRCPYVAGGLLFAPDKGVSKNPASWIGFHHVTHISPLDQCTVLKIGQQNELLIPDNFKNVSKMKERSCHLARTLQVMFKEWEALYKVNELCSSLNIVNYTLEEWQHIKRLPSFPELCSQFYTFKAMEILYQSFGEGNPRIEDMKNYLNYVHEEEEDTYVE